MQILLLPPTPPIPIRVFHTSQCILTALSSILFLIIFYGLNPRVFLFLPPLFFSTASVGILLYRERRDILNSALTKHRYLQLHGYMLLCTAIFYAPVVISWAVGGRYMGRLWWVRWRAEVFWVVYFILNLLHWVFVLGSLLYAAIGLKDTEGTIRLVDDEYTGGPTDCTPPERAARAVEDDSLPAYGPRQEV